MRRLIHLALLAAAFLGGCQAQHWLAVDSCLDRGGVWLAFDGAVPGGVCAGVDPR
ncbi:MAG TPA: hypothetical protein VMM59_04575 [Thermohalobaculum sp.]|nr:hypothetical protein [Thermohalobaculum sp.]